MATMTDYQAVAAGATDAIINPGTGGGDPAGNIIENVIVQVTTAATSAVSIKDGSGGAVIPLIAANTPVGTYFCKVQAKARSGRWRVTTGAGVTALVTGMHV